MTPWTRNKNWMYIRRSEGIEVVFWMSYIRPSYVVCARWLWTTIWYSVLFGKVTDQKILENTAQKRKFPVKNIFSKYDQIHRRLQNWLHLLKIYLMENFISWYLTLVFEKNIFTNIIVSWINNFLNGWSYSFSTRIMLGLSFVWRYFCKLIGLYFSFQYFLNSNNYKNRRSVGSSNHTSVKNVLLCEE